MRRKSCGKSRVCVGVDLASILLSAKNRVPQRLRGFVRQLSRPECFQPNLAFIERALRSFACAIQLFLQPVE